MGNVIFEGKNAFLPSRQILEGVVVENEMLDLAKRTNKSCLPLNVYFEKVYDSISWSFIDYMLMRHGFSTTWRKWMWGCYTTNSISVLVNGSPTSEFSAFRGLKQGDPLAPFLFIMAAVGLAGLIRKAEESKSFKGLRLV